MFFFLRFYKIEDGDMGPKTVYYVCKNGGTKSTFNKNDPRRFCFRPKSLFPMYEKEEQKWFFGQKKSMSILFSHRFCSFVQKLEGSFCTNRRFCTLEQNRQTHARTQLTYKQNNFLQFENQFCFVKILKTNIFVVFRIHRPFTAGTHGIIRRT